MCFFFLVFFLFLFLFFFLLLSYFLFPFVWGTICKVSGIYNIWHQNTIYIGCAIHMNGYAWLYMVFWTHLKKCQVETANEGNLLHSMLAYLCCICHFYLISMLIEPQVITNGAPYICSYNNVHINLTRLIKS